MNMKFNGYKYLILSMAAAFSLTSCLDEDPLYSQNNEIVFSNAENANLALRGCYSHFASSSAYGQNLQEVLISVGGHSWAQRNASDQDLFVSLNPTPSIGQVGAMWDGLYKVISESNAFIENMQSSGLDETTVTQYVGEAKFLRAVAYLNLVTLYGDVPLKTIASTSEGIALPRSPREEVFNQIIQDLTDALAISEEPVENERACRWTVKAYLGKAYHKMASLGINTQQNLENAKNYFDDVYNNGPYELESSFSHLFGDWVTGSKEAIFQIDFLGDPSAYYNRGSNRLCPQSSTSGINWTTFAFSFSAYDLHAEVYPGDPRIKTTFLTSWRSRNGNNQANPKPQVGDELSPNDSTYTYPYITYDVVLDSIPNPKPGLGPNDPKKIAVKDSIYLNGKGVAAKLYVTSVPRNMSLDELANLEIPANATPQEKARIEALRKTEQSFARKGNAQIYPSYGKAYDQNQSAQAAHKNLMVYRYAEMLLLMADVYNELGQSSRAVELANEVLTRARNADGGSLTGQPANWSTSLDQATVREKLYFERIFELWGEPDFWDMTRLKGTEFLKEFLDKHNQNELVQAGNAYYNESNNAFTERLYNNGDLSQDFLEKCLLFPIPQSEIDANPSITDNNPGY